MDGLSSIIHLSWRIRNNIGFFHLTKGKSEIFKRIEMFLLRYTPSDCVRTGLYSHRWQMWLWWAVMTMSLWLNYPLLACSKDFPLLCVKYTHQKWFSFLRSFLLKLWTILGFHVNLNKPTPNPTPTEKNCFRHTNKKTMNLFVVRILCAYEREGERKFPKVDQFSQSMKHLLWYLRNERNAFENDSASYTCKELEFDSDLFRLNDIRILCTVETKGNREIWIKWDQFVWYRVEVLCSIFFRWIFPFTWVLSLSPVLIFLWIWTNEWNQIQRTSLGCQAITMKAIKAVNLNSSRHIRMRVHFFITEIHSTWKKQPSIV